jgi:uncharacterized membrane protein
MRALALLALLASPASAAEEGWPALHDVVGVALNDVLNIREAPSAKARIVGTYAPDATAIEVVGPAPGNSRWGTVNVGEQTGYVSLRFLQRDLNTHLGSDLPIRVCFGTEPFWDVLRDGGQLKYRNSSADIEWALAEGPQLANIADRKVQIHTARAATRSLTLFARLAEAPKFCGDGMSDRSYGIHASLLAEDENGMLLLTGCCSLVD